MESTEETGSASSTLSGPHRLEFEVPFPPNDVAAYLLEGPSPVLIDAGLPGEDGRTAMVDELAAHGYRPADLAAVVLTHPHTDHVGQVSHFLGADVPVYAPQPALDALDRDVDELADRVARTARSAGLDDENVADQVERARRSLRHDRDLLDPDAVRGYAFGDPLRVGGIDLEPIHTPGHHVHHASLAATVGGENVLFSGDVLVEPFRTAALHVGMDAGAYEAVDAFYRSMDRLAARSVDRVYPGHGPIFADHEAVVEYTRGKLDTLLAATREAVAAVEPAPPIDVAVERVGRIEHPAGVLDTLGALGTLERRGAVTHETELEGESEVRYYATTGEPTDESSTTA